MKKELNRRKFVGRLTLATMGGLALNGCNNREKGRSPEGAAEVSPQTVSNFRDELMKNRQMPEELVMKMLDQKVDQFMQRSHHCAQSSFMSLKEQFGLDGDQVFKALTPLPGIAERGETCGAVTGPLMAMGLIYGRDPHHMEDWDAYQASLIPAGKFCNLFEKEFGTTLCHKVQETKFGRCYHLTNPDELQEFQNAGATEHCSAVVRSAVHMAAKVILDDSTLS